VKVATYHPPPSERPQSFGVDDSILIGFRWFNYCTVSNSHHDYTLKQLPEAARAMAAEAIGEGLNADPEQGPMAEPRKTYHEMSPASQLRYVCHVMKSQAWKDHVGAPDSFHKKRNTEARKQPNYEEKCEKVQKNPTHSFWVAKVCKQLELDWGLRTEHLEDLGVAELKKIVKASEDEAKNAKKRKREEAVEDVKAARNVARTAAGLQLQNAATWDGMLSEARVWYTVEMSKSDRSACKLCGNKIPKQVPRIGLKQGMFHGPSCECHKCEAAKEELRALDLVGFYHLECVVSSPGVHVRLADLQGKTHSGWGKLPKKGKETLEAALGP